MTLTSEFDLDCQQHVKYLGQRSFRSNVINSPDTRTHTHWINWSARATKLASRKWALEKTEIFHRLFLRRKQQKKVVWLQQRMGLLCGVAWLADTLSSSTRYIASVMWPTVRDEVFGVRQSMDLAVHWRTQHLYRHDALSPSLSHFHPVLLP